MGTLWHKAAGQSHSDRFPNLQTTLPGGLCTITFNKNKFEVRIHRTHPITVQTRAVIHISNYASIKIAYTYAKSIAEKLLELTLPPKP